MDNSKIYKDTKIQIVNISKSSRSAKVKILKCPIGDLIGYKIDFNFTDEQMETDEKIKEHIITRVKQRIDFAMKENSLFSGLTFNLE